MNIQSFESELFEVMGLESSLDNNTSWEYDEISWESSNIYDDNYVRYSEESTSATILLKISEEYINSSVSFESGGDNILIRIFKFILEIIKKILVTIKNFFMWIINGIKSIFGKGSSNSSVSQITSSSNENRNQVLQLVQTKIVTVPKLDNKKLEQNIHDLQIRSKKAKDISDELCKSVDKSIGNSPTDELIDKQTAQLNELREKREAEQRKHDAELKKWDEDFAKRKRKDELAYKARKEANDVAEKARIEADKRENDRRDKERAIVEKENLKKLQDNIQREHDAEDKRERFEKDKEMRRKHLEESIKRLEKLKEETELKEKAAAKKKIDDKIAIDKEIDARRAGRLNSLVDSRIATQITIAEYFNTYKSSDNIDESKMKSYTNKIQIDVEISKKALDQMVHTIDTVLKEENKTMDIYNSGSYTGRKHNLKEGYSSQTGYIRYLERIRYELHGVTSLINQCIKDETDLAVSLMGCVKDNVIVSNIIKSAASSIYFIEVDGKSTSRIEWGDNPDASALRNANKMGDMSEKYERLENQERSFDDIMASSDLKRRGVI